MELHAYFDDSGTDENSPISAWGGFLGTEKSWALLVKEWKHKLNQPMLGKESLSQFHLYDCKWILEEFVNYNRAESDLIRKEFRDIITASDLIGVGCLVDKTAHENKVKGWANYFLGSTTVLPLVGVVEFTVRKAREKYPNVEHIVFHIDVGQKSSQLEEAFHRGGRMFGSKYTNLTSVVFEPVVDSCPLQAADTLVTELFWYCKDMKKMPNDILVSPHLAHFWERQEIFFQFVDEEYLQKMTNSMRLG